MRYVLPDNDTLVEATKRLKERYPKARDVRISQEMRGVLGGTLLYFEYTNEWGEPDSQFVLAMPDRVSIFNHPNELIMQIQNEVKGSEGWLGIFRNILNVGGIAGVIAILAVLTVAGLSLQKGELLLPETWQTLISAIVGFYFGAKVGK